MRVLSISRLFPHLSPLPNSIYSYQPLNASTYVWLEPLNTAINAFLPNTNIQPLTYLQLGLKSYQQIQCSFQISDNNSLMSGVGIAGGNLTFIMLDQGNNQVGNGTLTDIGNGLYNTNLYSGQTTGQFTIQIFANQVNFYPSTYSFFLNVGIAVVNVSVSSSKYCARTDINQSK